MGNTCPTCGKDDAVEKVSSIAAGRISAETNRPPSGGTVSAAGNVGTYTGDPSVRVPAGSALASLLAPPPAPRLQSIGLAVATPLFVMFSVLALLGMGMSCCSIAFMYYYWSRFSPAAPVGMVPAISLATCLAGQALAGVAVVLGNRVGGRSLAAKRQANQRQYEAEKAAWDRAMERWNRLYYCKRDDTVFDGATGEPLTPHHATAANDPSSR